VPQRFVQLSQSFLLLDTFVLYFAVFAHTLIDKRTRRLARLMAFTLVTPAGV
jgi:hypothetical protein